ncbi:MAG: hypothetical protein AB1817_11370 [Chloroflexota bacterium]
MKTTAAAILGLMFCLIAFLVACASASPTAPLPTPPPQPTYTLLPTYTPPPTQTPLPQPTQTLTPAPMPSRTPTLTASARYQSAFGIDYGAPEKYLAQGEQTRLSHPKVIDALRGKP